MNAPKQIPEGKSWGVAILGVCFVGGGVLVLAPEFLQPARPPAERNASAALKTLRTAQLDFRNNDRDGNGRHDFWRGDIAGLVTIVPRGMPAEVQNSIKLIEPSVALADDRPLTDELAAFGRRGPKGGYLFLAIRHEGETEPSPDRFAACAFPAVYVKSGRWTFIVDERNEIYKRDLGRPGGIEVIPDEATLQRKWSRVD